MNLNLNLNVMLEINPYWYADGTPAWRVIIVKPEPEQRWGPYCPSIEEAIAEFKKHNPELEV